MNAPVKVVPKNMELEAVLFTGEKSNTEFIVNEFCESYAFSTKYTNRDAVQDLVLHTTDKGPVIVMPGDWIVKVSRGSFKMYSDEDFVKAFNIKPDKKEIFRIFSQNATNKNGIQKLVKTLHSTEDAEEEAKRLSRVKPHVRYLVFDTAGKNLFTTPVTKK